MKKVAMAFVLVFFCFMISVASAKDVAYIYKKSFRVDENIISVFNGLGLDVELVKEKDLKKTDFSEYKIIFVGDERFTNEKLIPVFQHPSVIANYYHGYAFGLTDPDGVSQLASNSPLNVKTEDRIIQVYTQAFFKPWETVAIPYYYLSDLNMAEGFRKIAATYTGDSYDLGSVIAYADADTHLLNGKYAEEKLCFFGIIESDFWTPAARKLFEDCAKFVAVACYNDEDCDDKNDATVDKCINPGTFDSYCEHKEIICSSDEDCGADGWVGEPHCVGADIYQDYKDFTCENPGTFDSSCSYEIYEKLVKTCPKGCNNGVCLDEHNIAIKIGEDYINGVKLIDADSSAVILDDPAVLENEKKYQIKFKIINLGSFNEEVEYLVSILKGSSVVEDFSTGTMTLDAGETSTDRTRTWNVNLPDGSYDIKVEVRIVGFADESPADNIVLRDVTIGEQPGECQDTLEVKPGINYVSLKCKYEENDIQSLFADKLSGGTSMASGDDIWKLMPGEYVNDIKYGINYTGVFQVDWPDIEGTQWADYQGKWFDPDTGALSTLVFEAGDGFLIENRHGEKTITLNGQEPSSITYNFVKGYNMFGVPDEMKASEFLQLVPDCFAVSTWKPDQEYWDKYYSKGYTLPDSKYWMYYPESNKYSDDYSQTYDINEDLKVDFRDAVVLMACAAGSCDVNDDGKLNNNDFLLVLENVGCLNTKKLAKYDLDKNGCIDDYDALAVAKCSLGECDINGDGKIDAQDRDLVLQHQQYNIENFNLEVNKGYRIECNKAVSLVL